MASHTFGRFLSKNKVILIILVFISDIHNVFSLECNSSQNNTNPQVSIFKIRNGTKITEAYGTGVTFDLGEPVVFRLECHSHLPVKWVFDEDFYERGITNLGDTLTIRTIGNFSDEKTYNFTAPYVLQINSPETQDPLVLVCQTVGRPCDRRVLLSSFHSNIKKYQVELLSKEQEIENKHVLDFEQELNKVQNTTVATCPFNLTLRYAPKYKALIYLWTPSGSVSIYKQESAQSFENSYRFTSTLDEQCIDFSYDVKTILPCPKCSQLNSNVHEFNPFVLYNAVGNDRRILKGFFDIQNPRSFYYSWEYVDPQALMYIRAPKEAYKGQEIEVVCDSSLFLFSHGTQITWSVEGDSFPRGFASAAELYEKSSVTTYGTVNTIGTLKPSKAFLDENSFKILNVSCISPIWNSTGWVTISMLIPLIDSTSPMVKGKLQPSTNTVMLGEAWSFKCVAEGYPPPSLVITPPQENLNFTKNETTEGNITTLIVTVPKVELTYGGEYKCIAQSVVGQDYRIFQLKISPGLSMFVKIVLIGGGVLSIIFVVIAAALTFKLRKEKEEFMRLTEQAILKFQEGFQNTPGIGFNSNSEYKDFEVPISRWEMSGKILGSGNFGVVQKGFVKKGLEKTVLAIKTVNSPKDVTDFENSLMELIIMSYIGSHVNIVSMLACSTENIHKRSLYIGVEFCSNGDLLSYLQKRKNFFHNFVKKGQIDLGSDLGSYANIINTANFSTADLYKWANQIANGMDYLESKKVLHADLACRNVLLTEDKIAKISDFGLSRKLLDSSNYTKKTSVALPWRWMALESLKFQQFSSKSDLWSYGVLLYELFSLGAEPWPDQGWTIEFVNELENGRRLAIPNFATDNIYNEIMLECWRNDPEERLTFAIAREYFETALADLNSTEEKTVEYMEVC